jgi:hypothetical protein
VSFAPVTTTPTGSLAPVSFAPVTTAPVSNAPTIGTVNPAPTAAPVVGDTTIAPSLAPDEETLMALDFTLDQAVSAMSTAEISSFKFNALVALIALLNTADAGEGTDLTTGDVSRTDLSDTSSRRSSTVYFKAYFPAATVTSAEATTSVASVSSSNPLVVSYTKADLTTGTGSASSAAVTAGTASPTAAPTTAASDDDEALSSEGVIALAVVGAIVAVVLIGGLVAWKSRQDKPSRQVHVKPSEPEEPSIAISRAQVA